MNDVINTEYRDPGGHKFKKGNPGKPKGAVSGRSKALKLLDELFSKEANLTILKREMRNEFLKDPMRFFKVYVMPLLPRQTNIDVNVLEQIDLNVFKDIYMNNYERRAEPKITPSPSNGPDRSTDKISGGLGS